MAHVPHSVRNDGSTMGLAFNECACYHGDESAVGLSLIHKMKAVVSSAA